MKKLFVFMLMFTDYVVCLYIASRSGNKSPETDINEKISYNFRVRPIFSDKCFKCHGPDANKREAWLRLDIEEEAYKALKEHPSAQAVVPGKPDTSELYVRISAKDTSIQMPPPSSNLAVLTQI